MDKFKYDGLDKSSKDKTAKKASKPRKSKDPEDPESDDDSQDDSSATAASLMVYSAFGLSKGHRLYNSWTLDSASDIHICNDASRSDFCKTRDALPGDQVVAGKTIYPIEAFGTVKINVPTPRGQQHIILSEVALAPGFLSNLVSVGLISAKGVH